MSPPPKEIIIAISIVIPIAILVFLVGYYCGWSFCFSKKTEQTRNKINFGSTLRGNLIRTYAYSIEVDYVLKIDDELGRGGCGVVVRGERKGIYLFTHFALI